MKQLIEQQAPPGAGRSAEPRAAPAAESAAGADSWPLVSCIMPTADRRRFVARAIHYFLAQDYPHKELIILDDGADAVADLVPPDRQVRYLRGGARQALGAKRNDCVEASRGDFILHWDDDDWMAPHRIRYQMEALLREGAEVCGVASLLFHKPATGQTWRYAYAGGRPWLAGGPLLYTRAFWRQRPFPAIPVGEDTRFIWSRPALRAAVLPDATFYIAMIHPGNTSPKQTRGAYWSRWPGDLRLIMGGDLDFYQSLYQAAPPPAAPAGGSLMKLNLGCCDALLAGYINVDNVPAPGVEVADLRRPWPWADGSVEHVRAWDIIEHLPDKIFTMNELWRVLRPGGTVEIAVPTTDGTGAFQDPTHVSFWNRRSFLYYEAGNPYRERFAHHYGIQARFRTLREQTEQNPDGHRLIIVLQAVKP